MTYRMLVLDLDGTTIPWGRPIDPRDVAAAHALRALGVHVTIATGRLSSGSLDAARALGVRGTLACMNGSERVDAETHAITVGHYLDLETRHAVRAVLRRHRLSPLLFTSREIHHGAEAEVIGPFLRIWTEQLVLHSSAADMSPWVERDDVLALVGFGAVEDTEAAARDLEGVSPEALEVVRFRDPTGERGFLKVRSARADKGTALADMAAERGLDASQVVAVGDWHNDVPMLRAAGRSYVVAHAHEDVRSHADEVLDADGREGGAVAEVALRVWGVRS